MHGRALAIGLTVLWVGRASAAEITEMFNIPAGATDGATLGVCKQLTVRTAGAGTVTVAGNGAAKISSPVAVDASFLRSSAPLPATYKVSVTVSAINFPQNPPGGAENGVTLLAIAGAEPLPASELWWQSFRLLAVEVDAPSGFANKFPVFINYWDASYNLYTWDGTQWGVGDPNWKPVLTYDPTKSYTVEIERTSVLYTIRVRQGATLLTQATVAAASVRPAAVQHFVVGDRLTSDFNGTMNINAVTMPQPGGCTLPGDGSVPPDLGLKADQGPITDQAATVDKAPDKVGWEKGPPDQATGDRAVGDGARDGAPAPDRPATDARQRDGRKSWDLVLPDLGRGGGGSEGCACELAARREAAPSASRWLWLAAVLLLGACRRRRP